MTRRKEAHIHSTQRQMLRHLRDDVPTANADASRVTMVTTGDKASVSFLQMQKSSYYYYNRFHVWENCLKNKLSIL